MINHGWFCMFSSPRGLYLPGAVNRRTVRVVQACLDLSETMNSPMSSVFPRWVACTHRPCNLLACARRGTRTTTRPEIEGCIAVLLHRIEPVPYIRRMPQKRAVDRVIQEDFLQLKGVEHLEVESLRKTNNFSHCGLCRAIRRG